MRAQLMIRQMEKDLINLHKKVAAHEKEAMLAKEVEDIQALQSVGFHLDKSP